MTTPVGADDDNDNDESVICQTVAAICVEAAQTAEQEQSSLVEVCIGQKLLGASRTSSSSSSCRLVCQPLTEAKTNQCYKLTVVDETDKTTTTPTITRPHPESELALFVKQSFEYAQWQPPEDQAHFSLTRTEAEADAMTKAAALLSNHNHQNNNNNNTNQTDKKGSSTGSFSSVVVPRVIACVNMNEDRNTLTTKKDDHDRNSTTHKKSKSKLLITEWQNDTTSLADPFLREDQDDAVIIIDPDIIDNIATSLALLNTQPIQNPFFNDESRPLLRSCWPMVQRLFRNAMPTTDIMDRCQAAMQQLAIPKANDNHQSWNGPAAFDHMMQTVDQAYMVRDCWGHGDAHVFNFLVKNRNKNQDAAPAIVICDWEMSLVGPRGKDAGYFVGFPIACALCHAASGRAATARKIVQVTPRQFCQTYLAKLQQHWEKDDDDDKNQTNTINERLCQVYRSILGWTGICLFPTYYLMKLFQHIWPMNQQHGSNAKVVESCRAEAMVSMGVLGLKAMQWGFVEETTTNDDDDTAEHNSNKDKKQSTTSLQELQQRFEEAIETEIEFLLECHLKQSDSSPI